MRYAPAIALYETAAQSFQKFLNSLNVWMPEALATGDADTVYLCQPFPPLVLTRADSR